MPTDLYGVDYCILYKYKYIYKTSIYDMHIVLMVDKPCC